MVSSNRFLGISGYANVMSCAMCAREIFVVIHFHVNDLIEVYIRLPDIVVGGLRFYRDSILSSSSSFLSATLRAH